MEVVELSYAKDLFDRVECTIDQDTIKMIRAGAQNDLVGVAEKLLETFLENNIIATIVVFKGNGSGLLNSVKVYCELTKEEKIYTRHAIVLFKDCCIDLLHSDRIIPMKEYMKRMEKVNPEGFQIDPSSKWLNEEKAIVIPTIEDLKQL
ncbi:MAG: hypothetical protein R3Y54_03680 [Eubacteriales bacterium]